MAIAPQTPIVVPAVPEKTFSEQWVYNLVVHAPTSTSGNVRIELLPYDPVTKEIGPGTLNQPVYTDKLWEAISAVPEVAVAFQAVIDCVGPLRTWIDAQNAPVVTPPVVEPEVVVEPEPEVVPDIVIEPEVVVEPEPEVVPDIVTEPEPVLEEPVEELLQQKKSSKKS
jgi:hypothetical protein